MNKVILMGRLTKDPELRYTNDKKAIARFSLAVDRKFSKDKETDFFNCTAFGKQGEFAEKYLKKGTKIALTGRIQNDNYTDKNGNKVNATQIITEEIEFAESKKTDEAPKQKESEFMDIPDGIESDLPFH